MPQASKATTSDGTLLGAVDGVNRVFTLAIPGYTAGSAVLFINGVAQCDFTETSPTDGVFTFHLDTIPRSACSLDEVSVIFDDDSPAGAIQIYEAPLVGLIGTPQRLTGAFGGATATGLLRAPERVCGALSSTKLTGTIKPPNKLAGSMGCPKCH